MRNRPGVRWSLVFAWTFALFCLYTSIALSQKFGETGLEAVGMALAAAGVVLMFAVCGKLHEGAETRVSGLLLASAAVFPLDWHASGYPRALQSWGVVGALLSICAIGLMMLLTGVLRRALTYWVLTALGLFLVAPFVWMALVSLHGSKEPIPTIDKIVPSQAHWENYKLVLFNPELPVFRFFINSLVVTIAVVVGQLFVSSLAAYGFSRLQFKGRDKLFTLFLLSLMFAGPVMQLPVYLIARTAGWLDTYWALIVPGLSSAFNVFLLRQFMLAIPKELDEAARIDGASEFFIYQRVILPLSKTALATAGAFTFFAVWTDFFWPLLATNSMNMRTLEVGLSVFKNSYGGANWPLQMTAAVIVILPLLLVFLFTQRFFVKGITMGSIK